MDSAQANLLRQELEGKTVGGWSIDKFIDNGKSAVVFRASRGDVTGALKVFHPELVERNGKESQLQRILREKSLVGAEHPHLVRILDGGECQSSGHLFVVMELLPFRNLHNALQDLPLDAVPNLISQVASAARFLEDRGLAHRDIKPENIAVTDDFSRAVLMDLGVLRPIASSNLTDLDQRAFIGTLRYSSPEFLLRQEEDTIKGWRAVTFYQLGAVLHDMLMKQMLFHEYSEPYAQLVNAVMDVNPKIYAEDARCVTLARHCLLKNPATRLELISWANFAALGVKEDAGSMAVAGARDRIKSRQRFFRASHSDVAVTAGEEARVQRQTLLDVCNRLESRIAAIINDLGCFPLREVKSEKDSDLRKCTTRVEFQADEDLGLDARLCVFFEITVIDDNGGTPICKLSALAVFAAGEFKPPAFQPAVDIFTGELSELLDHPKLVALFIDSLEAAYVAQEQGRTPTGDETLHLTKIAT